MNLTEAAKTITEAIEENAGLYARYSADELPALAADVNKGLPTPLAVSEIDELFARYLDAEDAASTATGYAIRYGSHSRTEAEAQDTVHAYADDLTLYLRNAGYVGEDFAADFFNDLT